jgi:hypothetical protein
MRRDFLKRLEKTMTGEPLWYIPVLQDIVRALQKLVGERFPVSTKSDAYGTSIIVDMGPGQPTHSVLNLSLREGQVTLTGFKGTSRSLDLGENGEPDEAELEEAVLVVLNDVSTLVQVCRSLN